MKAGLWILWAVLAGLLGAIVLLGYFFDLGPLAALRLQLMRWAVLVAAGGLFLGLANLLQVHWEKVNEQRAGWGYSALLIFTLLVTLAVGLVFGPDFPLMLVLFSQVQAPMEASLMAVLAVILVVAGVRMGFEKRDVYRLVFIGTAILVLLGGSPWILALDLGAARLLGNVRAWVTGVWSAAGARGILLGMALGAAATGLRVLMGADRPYGE
jgi:hypothetical protein